MSKLHPHWCPQDKLVHFFPEVPDDAFSFTLCQQYVIPSYKPSQAYAHMIVNCVFCLGTLEDVAKDRPPPTQEDIEEAVDNLEKIREVIKTWNL